MDEMIAQATAVEETASATAQAVEAPASFDELIAGDYKQDYERKLQQAVDKRFARQRETEARWKKWEGALGEICKAEGLEPEDAEGLTARLSARVDREKRTQALQEWAAARTVKGWVQQASAMAEENPAFDLTAECGNPAFMAHLKRGLTVQDAYQLCHRDELMAQAQAAAAREVKAQLMRDLTARRARPQENGLSGRSAMVNRRDPRGMTRAQREEIESRALRGERVVLG